MLVILALWRLRKKDREFKVSLEYMSDPVSKNKISGAEDVAQW
jgi:hypothetical protein